MELDETGNLIVYLAVREPPAHIVIAPKEVVERQFGDKDVLGVALANRAEFERAIGRAWNPDRLRELWGVGHAGRINQVWLEADDFA
jgi:hypothetical protein